MKIIDSTLREGEQCFGVYLAPEVKRDVLARLIRLGVDEVELGVAGRDGALAGLVVAARELASDLLSQPPSGPDATPVPGAAAGPGLRDQPGQANGTSPGTPATPEFSVWAPAREDAILAGAALGADWLHLGLPSSPEHMRKRLGLTPDGLLNHLKRHVDMALRAGSARVSLGLEDASRADPDFLVQAAVAARECGASRVRISDTVGVWHPLLVAQLVEELKAASGLAIGVHCHNDFGLGTANALSGLLAGADYADASVLGIGERAGLAALEELAGYLALRLGAPYRVGELPELCRVVAGAAGMDIPPRKAVVGSGQFACETGLHVHGLARDPSLFEPYDPARLGFARLTALGKKSGRAAVAAKLKEYGLDLGGRDLETLTRQVRAESERLGRPLSEDEARRILG